jgi:hypothetical protein
MFYVEQWRYKMHGRVTDTPEHLWQKKGKKFKTKYFAALKDLYSVAEKETKPIFEPENCCPSRKPRREIG